MKIGERKWDCKRVWWPVDDGKTENGFALEDGGDTLVIRNDFYEYAQAVLTLSLDPNSEYTFSVDIRVEGCERNPKDEAAYPTVKGTGAYPLYDYVGADGKIVKVGPAKVETPEWTVKKWGLKTNDTQTYELALCLGGNCSSCKGKAYFRNLTIEKVKPSAVVAGKTQEDIMPVISDITFELPCAATTKIRMRYAPAYCMSGHNNGVNTLQLYFNEKTLIAFSEAVTLSFFGERDGKYISFNDTSKASLEVFTRPADTDSIVAIITADGEFRPVISPGNKNVKDGVIDVKPQKGDVLFYIADAKYYPENKANGFTFTDLREWAVDENTVRPN